MAVDVQNYVVTREIALRTGDIENKYRTKDGRFIVDNRTLSKIKFTSDEIVNGLEGVEKITEQEAETMIAQGEYKMGDIKGNDSKDEVTPEKEETNNEETEE